MTEETRDRKKPIKVYVTPSERKKIQEHATASRLHPSTFLREIGLGAKPKSRFDREAIQKLVKLHADQGRLGGLLKLWLSAKPGDGANSGEVRSVLQQIESLQMELAKLVMAEKNRL
jgi:hypothetical protein